MTNTTRHAALPRQLLQLIEHQQLELRIQRAERLVHQQRFGLVDQRARQRDALAHAARKLRRVVVLESLQPDQLDHLRDPRRSLPRAARRGDFSSSAMRMLSAAVRHGSSVSFCVM